MVSVHSVENSTILISALNICVIAGEVRRAEDSEGGQQAAAAGVERGLESVDTGAAAAAAERCCCRWCYY